MSWTNEWPAEPGCYWFYGWYSRNRSRPARFYYVEAYETTMNSIAYVTKGCFLRKAEGAEGVWQPVVFPELPIAEASDGFHTLPDGESINPLDEVILYKPQEGIGDE